MIAQYNEKKQYKKPLACDDDVGILILSCAEILFKCVSLLLLLCVVYKNIMTFFIIVALLLKKKRESTSPAECSEIKSEKINSERNLYGIEK